MRMGTLARLDVELLVVTANCSLGPLSRANSGAVILGPMFPSYEKALEQPNFVFILADDCSYRDLELYGGPARTPHINKLAQQGMKFNRCYLSAPMCSPTRHALYTGLYPVKNGAHPNHARAYENVKSIPHYLKQQNYRVALSGKKIRQRCRQRP